MPPVSHRLLFLAAVLSAAPREAVGQEPVPLPRIDGPIVIDGKVDEPIWETVPMLPTTVYSPTFESEPTERTEIRVAYDDHYIYVSGRLYDHDPSAVRANTLYRDQYSGDDVFAIVLDSYDDYESAVWFSVNPSGARSDRTVSNDAEFNAGFPMNADWNSFWDAAATQDDRGWFAEMRIPFSSLGFEDDHGHVVMGMILYRFIARKNERHVYPAIPPNWALGFAKPSQAQRIVLDGVYRSKPLYVAPYVLGGVNRDARLEANSNRYGFNQDMTREVGLDVKYNPTSNLTLDLTANTDFAQVEADDQQINLTRFSLFFPEKRQFFQERAAIFEFNTGGFSRLFHSRRIGLQNGQPIRILGGARLVGRIGGTDIGVLNMQTASAAGLPSENFGVARLRRQVFNPYSTIGAITTTRADQDGHYNVAVGADGVFRPFGDEYLSVKWTHTFDDRISGSFVDASRFLARWERRNDNGFSYAADYIRSGSAYNPGLGFDTRFNYTFGSNLLQYQWFTGASSPFRKVTLRNRASGYLRNTDHTVQTSTITPFLEFELKSGAQLQIQLDNRYESVRDTFALSGGPNILPGRYWFHEGQLRIMLSRGGIYRGDLTLTTGSFFDGWRTSVRATPTWSISRHLELGGEYFVNLVRFGDRNAELNAHLARVRIQIAADIHLSLNTFVQYNSTIDQVTANGRLRYHFREGQDLWIVYNEAVNTDRDVLTGPRLPFSNSRVFLIKYTHTFIR